MNQIQETAIYEAYDKANEIISLTDNEELIAIASDIAATLYNAFPVILNDPDPEIGDNMTDAEADADTLKSAGYGSDEDYGYGGLI